MSNEENFKTTQGFKSYVSKPEITALTPEFLVKGSKNVLIDYANRIISRNGYTLFGESAQDNLNPNLVVNGDFADGDSSWVIGANWTIADGVATHTSGDEATLTQAIDALVDSVSYIVKFTLTGTAGTLKVILGDTDSEESSTTFSLPGDAGEININLVASIAEGGAIIFVPSSDFDGTIDNVSVTLLNNPLARGGIKGSYEWDTSTAKQFPLRAFGKYLQFYWNDTWNNLVTDLKTPFLEFAKIWDNTEKIDVLLWVLGDTNTYKWSGGVAKVASATSTTVTKQGVLSNKTTISFVSGDGLTIAPTILDSDGGFLVAGFASGDTVYVSGSASNNRNFTIGSVTAGVVTLIMTDVLTDEPVGATVTLHTGEPTWASARFLTVGTRYILLNGTVFQYTGGETTDTLTGLVNFTGVFDDAVWQAAITLPNGDDNISGSFKQDLIGVQLNQLVLASTKSQEIYISSDSNYTDFVLTSPRAPGDPAKVTMDNYCTCIIPIDNQAQTTSSLMFGGGKDEFFQFSYQLAQDNSNELVRMVKLKTAAGSGIISKAAFTSIKNSIAYISREPTLDLLSRIEGEDSIPLSDLIKNDFDFYDFTDNHVKYWKRSIYITLPRHGILLIYDRMRKLWHPPQTIPIGRLAIIGDWLYGHSYVSNETYKLFVGTDDNGNVIKQVARFAYNNGGRRDRIKNMSEFWSDGYISANGILTMTVFYGFDGVLGTKMMTINGGDTDITNPVGGSPLGDEPLGATPIGGDNLDPLSNLPGTNVILLRFWQADTANVNDYTEYFTEYKMSVLGGQFALVAYGSDQYDAGTAPITHKK